MKTAIASLALMIAMTGAVPASAPVQDHRSPSQMSERMAPQTYQEARGGCGSKGGPGWRKSNGQCASWKD